MAPDSRSDDAQWEIDSLRERVRLLEGVVDNFPGGISVFDKTLRMVFCNDQQKQLLDYSEILFASGYPVLEEIFRLHMGKHFSQSGLAASANLGAEPHRLAI
jgi:PAS domain-containing protein